MKTLLLAVVFLAMGLTACGKQQAVKASDPVSQVAIQPVVEKQGYELAKSWSKDQKDDEIQEMEDSRLQVWEYGLDDVEKARLRETVAKFKSCVCNAQLDSAIDNLVASGGTATIPKAGPKTVAMCDSLIKKILAREKAEDDKDMKERAQ
jgi:hypothetical protein